MAASVTLTRVKVGMRAFRPAGRSRAWYWLYEAVGPDGARFDNRSLVELRSVLRRRYGRELQIIEGWGKGG